MPTFVSPTIRPGQIWADKDPRMTGRTFRVVSISQDRVLVKTLTVGRDSIGRSVGKTTIISRGRLRPTSRGYDLIKDAPENES